MACVFDLDGVIWRGERPLAGAAAAVAQVRERGEPVLFVTNMSARPVARVEQALAATGIQAQGEVVTSAIAAAALVEPGDAVVVCAGEGVTEALAERGASVVPEGPADAVVVGYHPGFDYDALTVAMRAVRGGARLIGTNDDPVYPGVHGLLPGTGSLLAAVATAADAAPVIAGKPHEAMCALVRRRLGPDGWVFGDRADTDGAFARRLGYRFALVLSGVTGADQVPSDPPADLVAADVSAAVAALAQASGSAPQPDAGAVRAAARPAQRRQR